MRPSLAFAVALMLALTGFAGCIGTDDTTDNGAEDQDTNGEDERPPLPEPINATNDVMGSVDPIAPAMDECASPTSACDMYNFTAETPVRINAALTWEQEASDFDLYLYKEGEQRAASESTPPGTEERINIQINPGNFSLIVQPFAVAQDTYTLDATFEYA